MCNTKIYHPQKIIDCIFNEEKKCSFLQMTPYCEVRMRRLRANVPCSKAVTCFWFCLLVCTPLSGPCQQRALPKVSTLCKDVRTPKLTYTEALPVRALCACSSRQPGVDENPYNWPQPARMARSSCITLPIERLEDIYGERETVKSEPTRLKVLRLNACSKKI